MQTVYAKNPQDLYRRQGILTANPLELIVMLYDGLRKDLILAQRSIAKGNINDAHLNLMKAQGIILELTNSLDMSYEISENLAEIYEFILRHVREANIKKDGAMIGEALELVEELRAAWKEICDNQKKGAIYEDFQEAQPG